MNLPINETPFIRLYPEYLFIDSIINNYRTTNENIVSVLVDNFLNYQWKLYTENSEIKTKGNTVLFFKKSFDIESIKAFSRSFFQKSDNATFHIEQMQYTNRWDSILFFVDIELSIEHFKHYPGMTFVLGRYCGGDSFFFVNGEFHWIGSPSGVPLNSFRFFISNGVLRADASSDGVVWNHVYDSDFSLFSETDNISVGCMSSQENNQYYSWLFNNFIQYKFQPTAVSAADYIDFIKRDTKIYTVHPFIKFTEDEASTIQVWYNGIWNYVVAKIKQGIYVQLQLNESHIPDAENYQCSYYLHENLIYGFDDDTEQVSVLHIYQGKPKFIKLSRANLEKAYCGFSAVCFKYAPDMNAYTLDIYHIYNRMRDYLSGRNSSEDHAYICENDEGYFGIDVYNTLLNDKKSREVFFSDVRVAYMLLEHKKCMKERFDYFYEMGIIPESIYLIMKNKMEQICILAKKVMLLNIKNGIVPSKRNEVQIVRFLREMKETEKKCYSQFVSLLEVL